MKITKILVALSLALIGVSFETLEGLPKSGIAQDEIDIEIKIIRNKAINLTIC